MAKVSCLTPSFNKPNYVLEAIQSVLDQTYTDFEYYILENSTDPATRLKIKDFVEKQNDKRLIYIEENFTQEERNREYVTTLLLNKYFDIVEGEIIFYLSDDDIFNKECFKRVVEKFDANPDSLVQYFAMLVMTTQGINKGFIGANSVKPRGTNLRCFLDGGQIAFRKKILSMIQKPYYPTNWDDAASCDGVFLNNLSSVANFDPIPESLLTHRRTPVSSFVKEWQ